jgi:hypothetical protein
LWRGRPPPYEAMIAIAVRSWRRDVLRPKTTFSFHDNRKPASCSAAPVSFEFVGFAPHARPTDDPCGRGSPVHLADPTVLALDAVPEPACFATDDEVRSRCLAGSRQMQPLAKQRPSRLIKLTASATGQNDTDCLHPEAAQICVFAQSHFFAAIGQSVLLSPSVPHVGILLVNGRRSWTVSVGSHTVSQMLRGETIAGNSAVSRCHPILNTAWTEPTVVRRASMRCRCAVGWFRHAMLPLTVACRGLASFSHQMQQIPRHFLAHAVKVFAYRVLLTAIGIVDCVDIPDFTRAGGCFFLPQRGRNFPLDDVVRSIACSLTPGQSGPTCRKRPHRPSEVVAKWASTAAHR